MKYDIFFAGVGGQGILTIGEVLAEVAHYKDIPANFYPSKGMAQRGGFVKAQLRLGRENIGPNIPQRCADMIIAMEQSESLKAVPFIKPGGEFVLYGDIWAPTAVSLGKAAYPATDQITSQVKLTGARLVFIDPKSLPEYCGELVRANLYILGVVIGQTNLGSLLNSKDVEYIIQKRFKQNVDMNIFAYRSGISAVQTVS